MYLIVSGAFRILRDFCPLQLPVFHPCSSQQAAAEDGMQVKPENRSMDRGGKKVMGLARM